MAALRLQVACPRSELPWPLRARRVPGSLILFGAICPSCGQRLQVRLEAGQLGLVGNLAGHAQVARRSLL